jgi:hypothetical protein
MGPYSLEIIFCQAKGVPGSMTSRLDHIGPVVGGEADFLCTWY